MRSLVGVAGVVAATVAGAGGGRVWGGTPRCGGGFGGQQQHRGRGGGRNNWRYAPAKKNPIWQGASGVGEAPQLRWGGNRHEGGHGGGAEGGASSLVGAVAVQRFDHRRRC